MKYWILNLVGVSLMGVLIDVLLPSNNTSKYIKGVLSLVLIFVILSPMINLLSNYKSGDIIKFLHNDINVNYDFINEINIDSNKQEEKEFENILNNEGYKNVKVKIISNVIQQNKIEYVKISLKNLVVENETLNINIKEKINKLIISRLNISENRIYYE